MLEDWVYEDVRRGFENNLSFSEERLASSLCDEELFLNASHMLQQRVLQAFSNPNDEGDDIRILPQEAMIKDYRDMIDSLIGETKWLDMKKYTLSS